MTRCINGKFFRCLRAGTYVSDDETVGIYHVMRGTIHEQWEIYEDAKATGDPMANGEVIAIGLTMREAIAYWVN